VWTLLRVGVFYAAPVVAVAVAIVYFVVLLRRVRRGALRRTKAALLYSTTLLLPLAVVVAVWGVGELSSYLAASSDEFTWDGAASMQFLLSLLPLGAYVGAPIAALVVSFWATMALSRAA
jgi:hypothetical protein